MLGADDRLGAGQRGQRLVAVSWQQQALQVGAQAAPLRERAKQRVELGGVVLQGAGGGWAGQALGHRGTSASSADGSASTFPLPASANKLPLTHGRAVRTPATRSTCRRTPRSGPVPLPRFGNGTARCR